MKRIFFLSVVLSTFFCACVLAWLYIAYKKSATVKVNDPPPNIVMLRKGKSLLDGIVPTDRGCGLGYGQGYELPDGTKLGEGNSCFSSFREANKQMAIWLERSDRILDRVGPPTQIGEPRSERVVASFPVDEFGNRWVTVMWVQAQCIHYINGPALEYALALEKSKYNPYKFE